MNDLLNDIMGYSLDEEQRAVVYSNDKHILVVAGAGSGKSLTIIGKIRYLLEHDNVLPKDILCISFTRESSSSLERKLKDYYQYSLDIYTFHKLGLEILKDCSTDSIEIAPSDYLNYIIEEYFNTFILENVWMMKLVLKYFHISYLFSDVASKYRKFIFNNSKEFELFKRLLLQFLKLFKGQGYKKEKFYEFYLQNKSLYLFSKRKMNGLFLQIAWSVFNFYEEELHSSGLVDFDDMILNAIKVIPTSFSKKYRYIIIDEYQDTSYTRFSLIKAILDKTDANLLVVGDDFQSIYQFTGCQLDMFLNFKDFFPDAKIYKITNTYRNSQELIKIAGDFVMKNPRQIKKFLKSNKALENPIELYYTKHPSVTLKYLFDKIPEGTILVLGRNNKDIFSYLDDTMKLEKNGNILYKDRKIQFLTIHKSKGLEADHVILIHAVEGRLGIPSQVENSTVLTFVSNRCEYYPFEEERRLFYVALTRTKNKIYIISDKKCPSRFLKELSHYLKYTTYNEL